MRTTHTWAEAPGFQLTLDESYAPAAELRAKTLERAKREVWRKTKPRPSAPLAGALPSGTTLAGVKVPDEWVIENGYGSMSTSYYAGGRWKHNGRPQLQLNTNRDDVARAWLCAEAGGNIRLPWDAQFAYNPRSRSAKATLASCEVKPEPVLALAA